MPLQELEWGTGIPETAIIRTECHDLANHIHELLLITSRPIPTLVPRPLPVLLWSLYRLLVFPCFNVLPLSACSTEKAQAI